jgi:hypothetical protein
MRQPGDPPEHSGRSIYERLGLTPSLGPNRKDIPPPPPKPRRTGRNLVIAMLFLVSIAGFGWLAQQAIPIRPLASADQSRAMDRDWNAEDEKIQQLQQRIELLDIKVSALRKLVIYETPDGRNLPRTPDRQGAQGHPVPPDPEP